MGGRKQRKYRNQKVSLGDHTFDSKKEMNRFLELSLLQKAGEIEDLRCQVKYVLIPAQRDEKTNKLLERECAYVADFAYLRGGRLVVEDVKSKATKTQQYIIKRKLMLFRYGIRILEV